MIIHTTYDTLTPHQDTLLKTSLEKSTNRETMSAMKPQIKKKQSRNPLYSLILLNYSHIYTIIAQQSPQEINRPLSYSSTKTIDSLSHIL